jgi:hypothetical protein
MAPLQNQDAAMRNEVHATLQANPAAEVSIVLGNWRYRRGRALDEVETARVTAIYEEERDLHAAARATERRPWWRFW